MRRLCTACGTENPEGATVCPCGAALEPHDESDFQSFLSGKLRYLFLWLAIFIPIVATVVLLRSLNGPPSEGGPPFKAISVRAEDWQTRDLREARISLTAPGPMEPISLESLGVPKKVRINIVRADFYYLVGAGFDVIAGRMQARTSATVAPSSLLPPPDRDAKDAPRLQTRLCVAGSHTGTMLDAHYQFKGQALEGKSFVVVAPPEWWTISIRHIESDAHAADAAQRIAESILIDGQPVSILESPEQSLAQPWRRTVLVKGALSASAPMPWNEQERAAVALDAQLPWRPPEARYFQCVCASTSLTVGTGTCGDEHPDFVTQTLAASSPAAGGQSSPRTGIIAGRRAVVWTSEFEVHGEKRISRKVVTTDGSRGWIFFANYPAGDTAALELVDRAQSSIEGD